MELDNVRQQREVNVGNGHGASVKGRKMAIQWAFLLIWMSVSGALGQCTRDLTGNGIIDGEDFSAWLARWGAAVGEPNYLANYDFNGNSRVDVSDGLLLLDSFGICGPSLENCPVFPVDNVWNTPIDGLPVHPNSVNFIATMGAGRTLHPDFGSGLYEGGPIGIPYISVPGDQPLVDIVFEYWDESDPGPYPIPPDVPIEGGPDSDGDRHLLILDRDNCLLYEVFYAWPQLDGSWEAGSGAVFDLSSHDLRPDGWTSADAAGLPILPGLVRYDEVESGEIRHALRFTATPTQRAYLWPARHFASDSTNPNHPPLGLRLRLKADFDLSGFTPRVQTILRCLKKYGMILADNGSNWFISGAPDERWDNDELHDLQMIGGSNFEAVDESSLMIDPDSGQAFQPPG